MPAPEIVFKWIMLIFMAGMVLFVFALFIKMFVDCHNDSKQHKERLREIHRLIDSL